ncbi:MAG: hypothetical protein U9N72_02125 [Bacteroidota bacterium]|nr:hypothetical protein [Bacteroidota bacterium]
MIYKDINIGKVKAKGKRKKEKVEAKAKAKAKAPSFAEAGFLTCAKLQWTRIKDETFIFAKS